jgi:hypothetical protein
MIVADLAGALTVLLEAAGCAPAFKGNPLFEKLREIRIKLDPLVVGDAAYNDRRS